MKIPRKSIVIVAAIIVSGLVALPLISNRANAQEQSPQFLFGDICSHKVLFDNAIGAAKGWNPNGLKRIFTISDNCVNPVTSVVLVNTKQANFVICAVDYLYSGAFELNCNLPPANLGELHYNVFVHSITPTVAELTALAPDVAGAASARIAGNQTEAAPLTAEQTTAGPAAANETRTTTP
jgi:hypothetical protein